MSDLKANPAAITADAFVAAIEHPERRADAEAASAMMARVTGQPATMWGPSIVGFGRYRYRYDSGREGETCRVGFAPRKTELVFYVGAGRPEQAALLAKLGKHKAGKGCLYVKRLADVDGDVLEAIVANAYRAKADGEIV